MSIRYNNELECAGVIVSEYFVLTAAACVEGMYPHLFSIRAGSLAHNRGGSVHYVDRLIPNQHYKKNYLNLPIHDIALIKVKEPFTFDGTRDAISLVPGRSVRAGGVGKIYGWGWINSTYPVQLREGTAQINEWNACFEYFKGQLPKGQLCATPQMKIPCKKDAGGPLVMGVHLLGIISWGQDCLPNQSPHVFTDVLYYRDWINENVQRYMNRQ